MVSDISRLLKASREVVDAISFDDNGALIGGKWVGGNGGLLSAETRMKVDELMRVIHSIEGTAEEEDISCLQ